MASNTKKVLSEVLKVRLRVLFNAALKTSFHPAFSAGPILPDPVKDDYRIVDGITDHGKDRRNESLVDLHIERKDIL